MSSEDITFKEYTKELWKHVEHYRSLGFNIIPLRFKEKTPIFEWKVYQERKTTEEEVERWFKDKVVNVAIICGKISGNLFVIDFDNEEVFNKAFQDKEKLLSSTLVVKTGRGYHVYFRAEKPVQTTPIIKEVTIKGEGSYVVAPPSIHPNGDQYKIISKTTEIKKIENVENFIFSLKKIFEENKHRHEEFEEQKPIKLGKKVPYCIKLLLEQGVPEGERNERAFDIARYLFNKGKTPNEILRELKKWNKKNIPPLPEKELEYVVKSVTTHRYAFGCGRLKDTKYCHPACVYYKEDVQEENEEKDEVVEEFLQIYEEIKEKGSVLKWVKEKLDHAIVGEDRNKLLLWLIAVSRHLDEPQHGNVLGNSGIGKTHLTSNVLKAIDEEDIEKITRITPSALDYIKDRLKHKVLLVQQLEGAESTQANLHVLMTEKGLKLLTLRRGEDGIFEPYVIETEGPLTFISTTTKVIGLDEQFLTRVWNIYPDESEEQTERIQQHTSMLKIRPWIKDEIKNELKKVAILDRFLKVRGIRNVIIPYADKIKLPPIKSRIRRDHAKLLNLIEVVAFVNQVLPDHYAVDINGKKYIIANKRDFEEALEICRESLEKTVKELSPKEEEILQICKEIEKENQIITAREVAKRSKGKFTQITARKYLNHLVDLGYLYLEEEGKGRNPNIYSLNGEKLSKSFLADKIDIDYPDKPEDLTKYLASKCDIDITCEKIHQVITIILPEVEKTCITSQPISLSHHEPEIFVETKQENKKPISILSITNDNGNFSEVKQALYNYIEKHGPRTLEDIYNYLYAQGVKSNVWIPLRELINDGKVKEIEINGETYFITHKQQAPRTTGKNSYNNDTNLLKVSQGLSVDRVLYELQQMGGEAGISALAMKLRVQEGQLRLFLQDHPKYFVVSGPFVYTKTRWKALKTNGDDEDVFGERSL